MQQKSNRLKSLDYYADLHLPGINRKSDSFILFRTFCKVLEFACRFRNRKLFFTVSSLAIWQESLTRNCFVTC